MCNRPIQKEDIRKMNPKEWDLKLIVLEGTIASGMTLYPIDYYLKKERKKKKNKEG